MGSINVCDYKNDKTDSAEQYCYRCKEYFKPTSVIVRSLSHAWHFECLRCDICRCALDEPFIYIKDNLVCRACYEKNNPGKTLETVYDNEICPRCGLTIDGLMVKSMGRCWHDSCLLCGLCGEPVSTWFYGHPFWPPLCQMCHTIIRNNSNETSPDNIIGPCQNCQTNITKCHRIIRAFGRIYHRTCFKCTKCNVIIKGLYNSPNHNGDPYCLACYSETYGPKCENCKKRINEETYQVYKGKNFHNDCFKCSRCKICLMEKDFIVVRGMLLCPEHVFTLY